MSDIDALRNSGRTTRMVTQAADAVIRGAPKVIIVAETFAYAHELVQKVRRTCIQLGVTDKSTLQRVQPMLAGDAQRNPPACCFFDHYFLEMEERRQSVEVNIAGIDRVDLLMALHDGAKIVDTPATRRSPSFDTPLDLHDAEQWLAEAERTHHFYFDYVNGRPLKVDLRGPFMRTVLYNQNNGVYAAEDVVLRLRQQTNSVTKPEQE